MSITALPSPPSTNDPANFATKADALLAALPTFVTEANATAAAMNLNSTNDTSASSVAIGTGAKSFTVSTGKSFQPGMYLVIADTAAPSTNSMFGQITSYNTATGALVMSILSYTGSGTKTAWTISQSSVGLDFQRPTSFRADNNGTDITTIATATYTKLTLGTERHDTNSEFASGTFTAKTAGIHRFYFQFSTINPTAGQSIRANIYHNGASIAEKRLILQGTNAETVSVYTEVNLAIGGTIEPWVYHNRGTNEDVSGAVVNTFFCGGFTGAVA